MIAHGLQLAVHSLHEVVVLVVQPAGEEALALDHVAGVAHFLANRVAGLYLQLGILGHQLLQQSVNGSQHALLGLANQQAAVIGGTAVLGHNGSTGVRSGLDVGQLQNAVAQNGVMGGLQSADGLDNLGHLVNSVDALFGVGAVAGLAEGLDHDLGTAALTIFRFSWLASPITT